LVGPPREQIGKPSMPVHAIRLAGLCQDAGDGRDAGGLRVILPAFPLGNLTAARDVTPMQLGLDIGTSAVKAVLVQGGRVTAQADAPLTTSAPLPYHSEQDPEQWWQAVQAATAQLPDRARVTAIGLSGQMHGLVALDAAHAVIRPAILWNDGRSHPQCAAIAQAVPQVGTLAGVPPLPGFTAPKVLWMARHEPANHARIAHVLLPKDEIARRLTGELGTDPSDAAGTLWLDQAARAWSPRLAEASATDPAWLPAIRSGHQVAGTLTAQAAEALGLRAGIPVATGAGDAAAGALSAGAIAPGRAMLSLGTSGQLLVIDDRHAPNPDRLAHAYCHTLPGLWLRMAAMLNGARPMAWFANVAQAPIPTLLAEAALADPERAPLFLPYLTGERTPHGDPHIRGAFHGLEDSTDRGAMMRAVVEAIAFSFADATVALNIDPGALATVPAIGGGTRSDLLLQTIADAAGLTLARIEGAETGPALGAAMLAALATGEMNMTDLSRPPALSAPVRPARTQAMADRLARWRALYHALAPLSAGRE
jgi:xylulokinase